MTKVKICGIKEAETLCVASDHHADFVGFVFADSKRYISPQKAAELLADVRPRAVPVGVFVNPALDELREVLARVPLQVVQLHGQESPGFCADVRHRFGVEVWKAVAVDGTGNVDVAVSRYRSCVDALLFDTYDPNLAGGTGRRFAWTQIPRIRELAGETPFVIAGGINEANVSELLSRYAPPVIDVSSGVETEGKKDPDKIIRFLERVKGHENDRQHENRSR